MIVFYLVLSFAVWLSIWYWYFYIQFWQKDIINELRSENRSLNSKLESLEQETKELQAQNEVLKTSIKDYKDKNYDLKNIVGELSRYQHAVKQWWEIALKLQQTLSIYDPNIKNMIDDVVDDFESDDEDSDWDWNDISSDNKKFF